MAKCVGVPVCVCVGGGGGVKLFNGISVDKRNG